MSIEVASEKFFILKAQLASVANKYILEIKLNGQALDRIFITHQEIMDGGTLEFAMGAKPNKELFK